MSIVGLRSYEYQRATDLDSKLRELVDQIREDLTGSVPATRRARLKLALELSIIAEFLDPLSPEAAIHARESLRLPVPVLQHLRNAQVHGRSVREGLDTAVHHLREHDAVIDDTDIAVFEKVLEATSNEASDAFDRVVRR